MRNENGQCSQFEVLLEQHLLHVKVAFYFFYSVIKYSGCNSTERKASYSSTIRKRKKKPWLLFTTGATGDKRLASALGVNNAFATCLPGVFLLPSVIGSTFQVSFAQWKHGTGAICCKKYSGSSGHFPQWKLAIPWRVVYIGLGVSNALIRYPRQKPTPWIAAINASRKHVTL